MSDRKCGEAARAAASGLDRHRRLVDAIMRSRAASRPRSGRAGRRECGQNVQRVGGDATVVGPKCKSRSAAVITTSSPTRPRGWAQMAGVWHPHRRVADHGEVGAEFVGIGKQERLQRRRAGLLLPLEQQRQAQRQLAVHLLVGPDGLDKVQSWPLSSEVPRPVMILRPLSGPWRWAGSRGRGSRELQRIEPAGDVVIGRRNSACGPSGPARHAAVGDDHRVAGRLAHRGAASKPRPLR